MTDNGFNEYDYMPQSVPAPEERPRRRRTARLAALALGCALLGGAVGAGGVLLGDRLLSGTEAEASGTVSTMLEAQRESAVLDIVSVSGGEEMSAAEVYAANVNSTVGITTSVTTNFWGHQTTSAASGSGFLITDDGYILTNYHIVEDSDEITVSTYDGGSYAAALIGYDESNDIAVLKIEAEGLVPVVLGDSDDLNVGDGVVAIGNPLGELTFSLTTGVVSALDRQVTLSSSVTMTLIQTDCAINSGNSGGALFNLYGEVIGITNAKYSGSGSSSEASIDNIGFAIPINDVKAIAQSIIENGYVVKPYIGVTVSDVSAEAQSYGLPAGAAVASVTAGSPAEAAGLQANDIITAVDGAALSGSAGLVEVVGQAEAGDELALSVYRQGETLTLTVTVGEQTQAALAGETDTEQGAQSGQAAPPWGYGN